MRKVDGWCWGLGLSLLVPMLAGCGKDDGSRDSAADGGATGIPLDGGDDGATGGADDDDDGDEGDKLDVGSNATGGLEGCGGDAGNSGGGGMGGEEEFEFSYIWIANSVESTISKIDTRTLVEEGRYLTRPDQAGSPSRTSVNLSGDVGVANRSGGVTKVIAVPENCPDKNGNGVVDTAAGAAFLPWDQDECVAWHTPLAYQSQRPVAWAPGEWNPSTCQYDKQELWSAGSPGMGQAGGADVMLFDGDTGAIVNTVFVPEVNWDGYGIYGGAVDGVGNFWGTQLSGQILVYVNRETFEYKTWPVPISSYGMTVDSQGFVWACAYDIARFDPATELWQTAMGVGGSGGCMEDGNGTLWLASQPMIGVDTATMAVTNMLNVPEYVHGVSIDFDGFVWGVALQTPNAYKGDPATGGIQTFTGLNGPYTYSDMTGFALKNAGTIPPPAG
jgi:hypothetical protein